MTFPDSLPKAGQRLIDRHNYHFNLPLNCFHTLVVELHGEVVAHGKVSATGDDCRIARRNVKDAIGDGATDFRFYNELTGEPSEWLNERMKAEVS